VFLVLFFYLFSCDYRCVLSFCSCFNLRPYPIFQFYNLVISSNSTFLYSSCLKFCFAIVVLVLILPILYIFLFDKERKSFNEINEYVFPMIRLNSISHLLALQITSFNDLNLLNLPNCSKILHLKLIVQLILTFYNSGLLSLDIRMSSTFDINTMKREVDISIVLVTFKSNSWNELIKTFFSITLRIVSYHTRICLT